jgi:predicted RecB family nuclease
MQIQNGRPLYSAKDLLNFLGCQHATALDLQLGAGSIKLAPDDDDPYLDLLQTKGIEHEQRYLDRLKGEGRAVREIARESLETMAAKTREAMHDGVDVIYQGALVNLPWHGYSDFLIRVDRPSKLGAWSYEVADTKLARSAKPKHVVQLCVYSDLLAIAQGTLPKNAHLILGDGSTFSVKLQDYIYYVRAAQERFVKFCADPERITEAEPCGHCGLCDWSDRCEEEWERTEHLSLVAALGRPQAKKLRAAGVSTIRALAELPESRTISKLQTATLTRLRSQARLQMHKRSTG